MSCPGRWSPHRLQLGDRVSSQADWRREDLQNIHHRASPYSLSNWLFCCWWWWCFWMLQLKPGCYHSPLKDPGESWGRGGGWTEWWRREPAFIKSSPRPGPVPETPVSVWFLSHPASRHCRLSRLHYFAYTASQTLAVSSTLPPRNCYKMDAVFISLSLHYAHSLGTQIICIHRFPFSKKG